MTKVEGIEKEIKQLSPEEQRLLRNWFLDLDNEALDKEIEADVAAGRLDALAEEALKEHAASRRASGSV